MPRKSQLPKRPRDVNQLANTVGRIATHQINDSPPEPVNASATKRGEARAKKLSSKRRKEIAQKAARKRWGKRK